MLDATQLTHLQACARRFLLEIDYEVRRWRPKVLFDAAIRVGIQRVSQGMDPRDAATELVALFLREAANPGLDLPPGSDSYKIAKDYAAMIETVTRAVARWELPKLTDPAPVPVGRAAWRTLAMTDPDGVLHRVITVDRWRDAELARELHSWYVMGDVCAAGRPMMIHVVEIGRIRDGRRASPWARGWKQPAMPNLKMRFVKKDGEEFKGWSPVWLADYPNSDKDLWVEQMEREGIAGKLVHHFVVDVPEDRVRQDTLQQMMLEANRAERMEQERGSVGWRATPMSRGACDGIVPCPWQHACHSQVNDIVTTGWYTEKKGDRIGRAEAAAGIGDIPVTAGAV